MSYLIIKYDLWQALNVRLNGNENIWDIKGVSIDTDFWGSVVTVISNCVEWTRTVIFLGRYVIMSHKIGTVETNINILHQQSLNNREINTWILFTVIIIKWKIEYNNIILFHSIFCITS